MGSKLFLPSSATIKERMYYRFTPFYKRYGKVFEDKFNFLMISQNWDDNRLAEYQNHQFLELIEHCYLNVPFYTKIFNDLGYTPKSFSDISDIKKLPILDKKQIIANADLLVATNMKHLKKYDCRTSGSTGEKLVFGCTDDVFKAEAAFVLRAFKAHGATMYDKPSVWLRRYVPSGGNSKLWYYDHELRRLYMSAYHLNERTIYSYIKKINSRNYHTLVAYPSSAYILAIMCELTGLNLKHIKAIHVASEMILPEWKQKIIDVFGIIPVAHYGATERVSFLHQKHDGNMYSENPEYGVTEYIPDTTHGYKIVATGFLNKYMPFLRYETEDTVSLNLDSSGYSEKVASINGRSDDILTAKDGSMIPGVNFYSWVSKSLKEIKMFQIVQKNKIDVVFYYISDGEKSSEIENKIWMGLSARLGELNFVINKVPEITRNPRSGKIRAIINEN